MTYALMNNYVLYGLMYFYLWLLYFVPICIGAGIVIQLVYMLFLYRIEPDKAVRKAKSKKLQGNLLLYLGLLSILLPALLFFV